MGASTRGARGDDGGVDVDVEDRWWWWYRDRVVTDADAMDVDDEWCRWDDDADERSVCGRPKPTTGEGEQGVVSGETARVFGAGHHGWDVGGNRARGCG